MKIARPIINVALILALILVLAVALEAGGSTEPDIVGVLELKNSPGEAYEGQFDILLAALDEADPIVLETLTGNGQHTLFAPDDDAFAMLGIGPGNGGGLSQETLTQVLLFHITHGRRQSQSVTSAKRIRMLDGNFVLSSGFVLTDLLNREANIIDTDIEAGNGIIHVIDAVLLPLVP